MQQTQLRAGIDKFFMSFLLRHPHGLDIPSVEIRVLEASKRIQRFEGTIAQRDMAHLRSCINILWMLDLCLVTAALALTGCARLAKNSRFLPLHNGQNNQNIQE